MWKRRGFQPEEQADVSDSSAQNKRIARVAVKYINPGKDHSGQWFYNTELARQMKDCGI
jgi:hypothetical protein